MVPGYGGGSWKTKQVGNVSILLLPEVIQQAALPFKLLTDIITTAQLLGLLPQRLHAELLLRAQIIVQALLQEGGHSGGLYEYTIILHMQ
jgi:hypothetical protein